MVLKFRDALAACVVFASLSENLATPISKIQTRQIGPNTHPFCTQPCKTFFPHAQPLILRSTTLWELESDTTASQLSVNLRVSVESVINTSLLLLVKNNLQSLASIFLGAETLADNLNWENEIGEDGIVDGGECSGTRSLLGEGCSGSIGSLWTG